MTFPENPYHEIKKLKTIIDDLMLDKEALEIRYKKLLELIRTIYEIEKVLTKKIIMNEWIAVTERLPEPEKPIIICANGKVMIGLFSDDWHGKNFFTTNFEQYLSAENVTHWMPLPLPEPSK